MSGRRSRRATGAGGLGQVRLPFPGRGKRPWWWAIIALLIAGASYFGRQQGWIKDERKSGGSNAPPAKVATAPQPASGTLADAIRAKRSGVIVEAGGVVTKTLPDDNDGARHQRFIVRVGADTVLIAHNLDLAGRVPLREGDAIRFKGEYEWNDRGGVVHWTHHDPAQRHASGWIEADGKRFE